MAAYGVGITPLFQLCKSDVRTKSVAFDDDLSGAERLHDFREWWDSVNLYWPLLGYYPKASKSWLVVKEDQLEEARRIFDGTSINVTVSGRRVLGGFIGNEEEANDYVKDLVTKLDPSDQNAVDHCKE